MDALEAIANRHGIALVEDAAEAHGATYKGRTVGSIGRVSMFSLFGNKIITSGEGGVLTTNDAELAARLRLHRGQGMDPKRRYWFPVVGYNYRMTNIQAAIGLAQLEKVDEHLRARQRVRRWYDERLAELSEHLQPPAVHPWAHHSFWMYTVVLSESSPLSRDELMARLEADGIETRPVFYPMHVMPPYRNDSRQFPVADHLAARGMNLPTHGLLSENDVDYVVARLRAHLTLSVALGRGA
jgi:perosamine synthetase